MYPEEIPGPWSCSRISESDYNFGLEDGVRVTASGL